tara:strand:+ start:500 stop:1135 length:636 start_codon:yes stop_codon:yes gene_type:complete
MHSNNDIKVLIFSSDHFINSFVELKDHFNFNFDFFEEDKKVNTSLNYKAYIIEDSILKDKKILKFLRKTNIPKLIIYKSDIFSDLKFDDKIIKPINIHDFNEKIISLVTKKQFIKNSFIKLKEYILDKNEKKLKKNDLFIILTEKEIQLLELLFNKKKPIKKTNILKEVWKYSDDADTHTVETHIYRLRKKIFDQFKDQNFISNSKSGYSL